MKFGWKAKKGPYQHFIKEHDYFLKGNCLHVDYSPREFIILEAYGGGLGKHFGYSKILALVKERFYWLRMDRDVHRLAEHC